MVVPMEQWASQPIQDKSADLGVVMLSDHNEKYSDRMERPYKAFAVTFELRSPFPLTWKSPYVDKTVFILRRGRASDVFFNVQTDIKLLQRLPCGSVAAVMNFISVFTLKQHIGGTSRGLTNIKPTQNVSRSD